MQPVEAREESSSDYRVVCMDLICISTRMYLDVCDHEASNLRAIPGHSYKLEILNYESGAVKI